MDLLTREIESRKAARAPTGDEPPAKRRKFMTKREKEEAERQQREEEERRKMEKDKASDPSSSSSSSSSTTSSSSLSSSSNGSEAEEKVLTRSREEVIRRLREAGRVVTYFGESDWDREQRFLQYEVDREQSEEYQRGLKNDLDTFRRQLEAMEADEIEAFINEGKKRSKVSSKDLCPFPDESILPLLSDKHDLVLFTFKVWNLSLSTSLS